jgi:NAD(P)-dependent dehydrogenase (short-subunit alcohol dehydrogenase family)
VVGQHEYISEFTKVGNFYLEVDEAEPGRFFESLKTGLRTQRTITTLLLDPTPPKGTPPSGTMYSVEDLIGEFLAEVKERREATIPAGRYGTAAEFGAMCAFLCSAHAGFIVGQNILLDGGAMNATL